MARAGASKGSLDRPSFTLRPVADTGDRFTDFGPYVPSINARGRVAFYAALRSGGGIFVGGDGPIAEVASTDDLILDFTSHPDITDDGSWSAYAELRSGEQALVVGRAGRGATVVDTRGSLARVGPLGPTMNGSGVIAFRADTRSGDAGIFKAQGASLVAVADTRRFADTPRFAEFHGLPVLNDAGRVVFRADLVDGGQGIYSDEGGELTLLADTSGVFAELGRFPCLNAGGAVAFGATRKDGSAGVFTVSGGEVKTLIDAGASFESVRGALIDDEGTIVFFATPRGGALGIHDAEARRVLSLRDPLFGSTIVDFALNPVSINGQGQLAIRVKLASGKQLIVRADPVR